MYCILVLSEDNFTSLKHLQALVGDGGGWNCLMDGSEELEESDWTDDDRDLIGPSVNLIKAAKVSAG